MRCGNCKQRHDTVSEVKKCYGLSEPHNIGLQEDPFWELEGGAFQEKESKRGEALRLSQEYKPLVPEGYYAIDFEFLGMRFFKVEYGKSQKWDGYLFIRSVQGGPGGFVVHQIDNPVYRKNILEVISKNPVHFMTLFGKHMGFCGRCGSPLTHPESRRIGMGPICRRKVSH